MSIADILDKAADRMAAVAWPNGFTCTWLEIGEAANWRKRPTARATKLVAGLIGGKTSDDIIRWNDTLGRSKPELVSKLREAAAKAREQGL